MEIATLIPAMTSDLMNLTWTNSDDGTSGFEGGFPFENWSTEVGSPFFCITEAPGNSNTDINLLVEFDTLITIHICSNWALIDEQNNDLKRAEAIKRLREAYKAVRDYVVKTSTLTAWGINQSGWLNDFRYENADLPELNLFRRQVIMVLKDHARRHD